LLSPQCIALLGRKDEPTDAIEGYCRYLGSALQAHDFQLEVRRVPWDLHGWRDALRVLKLQAQQWDGRCVLVQYTALAWSARGFPQRVLRVLKILKSAGACVGIVFHDMEPYPGSRLVDLLRRAIQIRTMSHALSLTDFAVFTVPPEKISWLAVVPSNAAFIPVGPNLPISSLPVTSSSCQENVHTIGVFSITGGKQGVRETEVILGAVRHTSQTLGKLRLSVFGRHSELREADLRAGLKGLPVELLVEGVAEPEQIVEKLSACDVLLFVRGGISSRRGSAIAGIACGLPLIAFSGPETAPPITEAGVVLVPPDQPDQLNAALARVLSDPECRNDLAARSRAAYQAHFAWPAIAARFAAILNRQSVLFSRSE
jgi:glycosyltransferase involved in cell wall biosynthesis